MDMMGRTRVSLMLLGTALLILPLCAQDAGKKNEPEQNNFDVFEAPLASPTEPNSVIRYAGDAQMDFGLALPLPIYSVQGGKSSWEAGLRPGILSRFEVGGSQLALKAADFRLGLSLAYRRGNWSARGELFHLSSHRGADSAEPAPIPPFSYSREALQTLVAYGRSERWRIYAGPTVLLRTHPSVGRWTLQAGTEWFPAIRRHMRAYLAADLQSREEAHWNLSVSVEPGVSFTTSTGQSVARVGIWLYQGQVRFGQFFQEKETEAGVHLVIQLRPMKPLIARRR